jgi:hypothetical protein
MFEVGSSVRVAWEPVEGVRALRPDLPEERLNPVGVVIERRDCIDGCGETTYKIKWPAGCTHSPWWHAGFLRAAAAIPVDDP